MDAQAMVGGGDCVRGATDRADCNHLSPAGLGHNDTADTHKRLPAVG